MSSISEFQLINRFFKRDATPDIETGVALGIGDDCALLNIPEGEQLAISVDTLVADVHFPSDAPADGIAERALRTNLSDVAAMGGAPRWFTLALTLPSPDEEWVSEFARGLFRCAKQFGVHLIGGDTTSGPLSITIQIMGSIPNGEAVRRDGASVGDFVLVTHTLGDGAAALASIRDESLRAEPFTDDDRRYLWGRFYQPTPRIHEGAILRRFATAMLDVSDGVVADLQHICDASDVGAVIDVDALPLSPTLSQYPHQERVYQWALSGGDDYELCFTVSPELMPELGMLIAKGELSATVIGRIVKGSMVSCELNGEPFVLERAGYQHF